MSVVLWRHATNHDCCPQSTLEMCLHWKLKLVQLAKIIQNQPFHYSSESALSSSSSLTLLSLFFNMSAEASSALSSSSSMNIYRRFFCERILIINIMSIFNNFIIVKICIISIIGIAGITTFINVWDEIIVWVCVFCVLEWFMFFFDFTNSG